MEILDKAPEVTGSLDERYLAQALARAGRPFQPTGELTFTPLTDGRTGAAVTRIAGAPDGGYVHKAVPAGRGFTEGLGNEGEGRFWLSGLTRDLPGALVNPVLDVAYHGEQEQWWLLMDDVSADVRTRQQWDERHTRRLFEAMAALHAHYWGTEAPAGAGSLTGTTRVMVETALHAATGVASEPWVTRAAQDFQVPGNLMPALLEALGSDDADFYIALCRRWPAIVSALERLPQTLVHGDLRWHNIGIADDRVALFDWEFFARAPAAVDLAWHWFFAYWAYPVAPDAAPDAQLWLREAYLARLEALLGHAVDRRAFEASWDLGWLRAFCQLGFLLADPLTEANSTREETARALWRCRAAIERARSIADARL